MKGMTFALISGFLAALASLCGKFSMTADETLYLCEVLSSNWFPNGSSNYFCDRMLMVLRVAFFALMIACNAVMWTIFTKALRLCTTTLEATVTNTASNFFSTAIFGQTLFGERLTLLWWLGTVLILFGLLLMHKGSQVSKPWHTRSSRDPSHHFKIS